MATNSQIEQDLRASGIEQGELLVVHASLGSMGLVEGGPETVMRALLNMIGPEGTLVMPAMTHRLEPYDPYVTTTINMGKIADLFWRRPDARCSDHPNSSFAAEGPLAAEIVGMHPLDDPEGIDSPIGKVYRLDGKILLLGVDHDANTTIHLGERLGQVPYR